MKNQNAVPFRKWFYNLGELRSLVSRHVSFMAITATATKKAKKTIISVLRFAKEYVEIADSPNKENISYSVQYMDKQAPIKDYFNWLVKELQDKKEETLRTIIYCQTIKQCSNLYSIFIKELGADVFVTSTVNPRDRRVEIVHALSSKENKKVILEDMSKANGSIKILICTIAFGMGVNCRAVRGIIHFGPSKWIESYVQESGRAGRDGQHSKALLLYQSLLLLHVDKEMKDYVCGKYTCRQKFLMGYFDDECASVDKEQICCDECCPDEDLHIQITPQASTQPIRFVSNEDRKILKNKLVTFRKNAVMLLISKAPKGNVPVLSPPDLLTTKTTEVWSRHEITHHGPAHKRMLPRPQT